VRFQVDATNANALFSLEANDATYRRVGLYVTNGAIMAQTNVDGANYLTPATLIPAVQANTWYVAQFTVDDVGGCTVLVYLENTPSAAGIYQAAMPAGKSWRFHHWIAQATAYLDDYEEFYGAKYTYDAAIPNGIGRRTSAGALMASRYVMQYDGRGRTLQTRHYNYWTAVRDFSWSYDSADRVTTQTYPTSDVATYQYDPLGRPVSLVSSAVGPLISGATYTPLDQPATRTFGNGVVQTWGYDPLSTRLSTLTVSGNALARSYGYDPVGNLTSMSQSQPSSSLWSATFGYDHRDRLTSWVQGATTESYAYTPIGNLTTKAGVAYSYPAAGAARPHTPTLVGGSAYSYDANGNLLSGGGRSYAWTGENKPERVITSSGTETYSYDADGQRMRRGALIDFEGGLIEETAGTMRTNYMFNGQAVAVREPGAATVSYLHGDQLGSISLTTGAGGAVLTRQEFDPWGKIRSGGVTQTKRNFTGQYLDGTGLLYYNARYYDPNLGRFISADTIAPGLGNPQNRNRYSYALNNPLKYTDPSGHCAKGDKDDKTACEEAGTYILTHGIALDLSSWMLDDLTLVMSAIGKLQSAMNVNTSTFNFTITRNGTMPVNLVRGTTRNKPGDDREAEADPHGDYRRATITLWGGIFEKRDMRSIIHELAHVWDYASKVHLSNYLASVSQPTKPGGRPDQGPTDYGNKNGPVEDWAETVAVTVLGGKTSEYEMGPAHQAIMQKYLSGARPSE
jgi:RHS repeat-associated protein